MWWARQQGKVPETQTYTDKIGHKIATSTEKYATPKVSTVRISDYLHSKMYSKKNADYGHSVHSKIYLFTVVVSTANNTITTAIIGTVAQSLILPPQYPQPILLTNVTALSTVKYYYGHKKILLW